jgi:phosphoserine / homoserine phosphotransferase
MLAQAEHGFLLHAPATIIAQFPQFPAFTDYGALTAAIQARI